MEVEDRDERFMAQAIEAAACVRHRTSPNPWVGAVVVPAGADVGVAGATQPPGGNHAEIEALLQCHEPEGSTVYTTLEPCSHHGRTGPCADALIEAGVARVVVALNDPDPLVAGQGLERLRAAGVDVALGTGADAAREQLAPYLHHRQTGRPWVLAKLAATLDGFTAAADGTSQWITGPAARADAHRLRAESDAILVGAGTVRADDPSLTVRDWTPADATVPSDPRRIVLGSAPEGAKINPCMEWDGSVPELLDQLGSEGVVQLMVEGGASVASTFHSAGLIDEYVVYLAPALAGGDGGRSLFVGDGPSSISDLWRGRFADIAPVGDDIRIRLLRDGIDSAELSRSDAGDE